MNGGKSEQHHPQVRGHAKDLAADNPWPLSMKRALNAKQGVESSELAAALSAHYQNLTAVDKGKGRPTYRAYSRQHQRLVRLKLTDSSQSAILVPLAEALSQISSPYMVTVHKGELLPDGKAALVMDWREGGTLQARIDAGEGPIPEATVLRWMEQVCEGMTFVAAQGIVHRNLKPSKIIINEKEMASVDDFSLATFSGTAVGPAGTVVYAAPEQMERPSHVDPRSDIYGFGATFYHALTGKAPFDARDATAIQQKKRSGALLSPQSLNPSLSEATARLLQRCLASDPKHRFQSFVELRTHLEDPSIEIGSQLPDPPNVPDYTILSELGRGGMGLVYRAFDDRSNRLVAIKVIRSAGQADLRQLARFRIEAEAVACLRHTNIVPVLNMGVIAGLPFLVLEYVGGGNLKTRIKERLCDPVWSARIAAGVARGLAHSHGCAILHRDLKPQNILLTDDDVPRITDFGLAKFTVTGVRRERLRSQSILPDIRGSLIPFDNLGADRDVMEADIQTLQDQICETVELAWKDRVAGAATTVTRDQVQQFVTEAVQQRGSGVPRDFTFDDQAPTAFGDIIGTPAYMAPEQTFGDPNRLGRHTDIFALGAILYEMLSGGPPYTADSPAELFKQIRQCSPAALSRDVPAALQRICLKCLAKNPEERYGRANHVADELMQFVNSREAKTITSELTARRGARKRWWRFWR